MAEAIDRQVNTMIVEAQARAAGDPRQAQGRPGQDPRRADGEEDDRGRAGRSEIIDELRGEVPEATSAHRRPEVKLGAGAGTTTAAEAADANGPRAGQRMRSQQRRQVGDRDASVLPDPRREWRCQG